MTPDQVCPKCGTEEKTLRVEISAFRDGCIVTCFGGTRKCNLRVHLSGEELQTFAAQKYIIEKAIEKRNRK